MMTRTQRVVGQGRLLTVALAGAMIVLPACGDATDATDPSAGVAAQTQTQEPAGPTTTEEEASPPAPCQDPADRLDDRTVTGGDDLPEAAADTAQQLLDLASSCDLEALVARAEADGTTVSLGATRPGAAFDGAEGEERALAMTVLLSGFVPSTSEVDGGFVQWPAEDVLDDEEASARLVDGGLDTQDEVSMMREHGGYTGWRVVVDAQGTWTFMGGGD